MNFLFYLFLLVAGGAAYYEYTWQQQTAAGFQTQIESWQEKVDAMQAENKKLTGENADLTRQATEARNEIAQLTTDLAQAQKKVQQDQELKTLQAAPPASGSENHSNALGTITTLLGQTYPNAQLLKVEANDIVISYDGGITQIPYLYMPPALQKRFGYDPAKAAALDDAQIRYQEQLREANTPTSSGP